MRITDSECSRFAPLSPKLMIVLRSNLLPVPEEDRDPEIKAWRDARRKEAVDDWYGASKQSILADLPIHKARNNYSQVVDGELQRLPGADGQRLKSHKFCFSFFPVGMDHVNKINHILFDNAYRCTNIVFRSREVFFNTLEWYMTCPAALGKLISADSGEERHRFLKNLGALMKSMGSKKEPVWAEVPAREMSEFDKMRALQRSLQRGMADWMLEAKQELQKSPETPSAPKFAYLLLGKCIRNMIGIHLRQTLINYLFHRGYGRDIL